MVTVNFDFERALRTPQPKKLNRVSDGDTPVIEQPVRMVSCDTPEKAGYAGKPETSQPKLDTCRERLENGFYDALPQELREYLIEKLTPDAAAWHIAAGMEATNVFNTFLEDRLTRPSGTKRNLAIIPTGEIVDMYGRLLAYLAPWLDPPLPPKDDPERQTFNLNMIESGWAAFFPIYPSLPRNTDMNRAIAAAESAWEEQRGVWATQAGSQFLLAYEFRACVKLGTANTAAAGLDKAFQRVCVDLRNLRIVGKYGFHAVPPCYRLWAWEKDLPQARIDLGLVD